MTKYVYFALALIAFVLIGIPAFAGNCQALFHHRQVHHVQAVALVQPLYFAGAATEQESIVRKVVREELRAALQAPQQQTAAGDYANTLLQKSVMVQKCNKCHSSDGTRLTNPDGTLDPMKFRAFARMAGLGKDIPDQMKAVIASLTPEEKGNITEALLALPPATEQKKSDGTLD